MREESQSLDRDEFMARELLCDWVEIIRGLSPIHQNRVLVSLRQGPEHMPLRLRGILSKKQCNALRKDIENFRKAQGWSLFDAIEKFSELVKQADQPEEADLSEEEAHVPHEPFEIILHVDEKIGEIIAFQQEPEVPDEKQAAGSPGSCPAAFFDRLPDSPPPLQAGQPDSQGILSDDNGCLPIFCCFKC